MNFPRLKIPALLFCAFLTGAMGITFASADTAGTTAATSDEINSLKDEIDAKQANIDQIQRKIDEYKKKIDQAQAKSNTLANDLELLENRVAKTELDIQSNGVQISAVNDQIRLLDAEIAVYEKQLTQDRALLSEILQKVQAYDNDNGLQLLFGTDSFSELFTRLQRLENVNSDLVDALKRAEGQKQMVESARTEQEGKRERLVALQTELQQLKDHLDDVRGSKEILLSQSQESEAQFQSLVYGLRQESASIDQEVARLQGEIENKLSDADKNGGTTYISWPVDASYKGLSTRFHDPTYPFRHLFEHSGIDVPEPQGTALKAAAPGYVAWTRTGRLYGNYIMIVHANGLATLYAHLSKISVKQDQFVSRGDIIGATGGAAGSAGAGLSTGPHLHFEVRKNGIPVDPMGYLPAY